MVRLLKCLFNFPVFLIVISIGVSHSAAIIRPWNFKRIGNTTLAYWLSPPANWNLFSICTELGADEYFLQDVQMHQDLEAIKNDAEFMAKLSAATFWLPTEHVSYLFNANTTPTSCPSIGFDNDLNQKTSGSTCYTDLSSLCVYDNFADLLLTQACPTGWFTYQYNIVDGDKNRSSFDCFTIKHFRPQILKALTEHFLVKIDTSDVENMIKMIANKLDIKSLILVDYMSRRDGPFPDNTVQFNKIDSELLASTSVLQNNSLLYYDPIEKQLKMGPEQYPQVHMFLRTSVDIKLPKIHIEYNYTADALDVTILNATFLMHVKKDHLPFACISSGSNALNFKVTSLKVLYRHVLANKDSVRYRMEMLTKPQEKQYVACYGTQVSTFEKIESNVIYLLQNTSKTLKFLVFMTSTENVSTLPFIELFTDALSRKMINLSQISISPFLPVNIAGQSNYSTTVEIHVQTQIKSFFTQKQSFLSAMESIDFSTGNISIAAIKNRDYCFTPNDTFLAVKIDSSSVYTHRFCILDENILPEQFCIKCSGNNAFHTTIDYACWENEFNVKELSCRDESIFDSKTEKAQTFYKNLFKSEPQSENFEKVILMDNMELNLFVEFLDREINSERIIGSGNTTEAVVTIFNNMFEHNNNKISPNASYCELTIEKFTEFIDRQMDYDDYKIIRKNMMIVKKHISGVLGVGIHCKSGAPFQQCEVEYLKDEIDSDKKKKGFMYAIIFPDVLINNTVSMTFYNTYQDNFLRYSAYSAAKPMIRISIQNYNETSKLQTPKVINNHPDTINNTFSSRVITSALQTKIMQLSFDMEIKNTHVWRDRKQFVRNAKIILEILAHLGCFMSFVGTTVVVVTFLKHKELRAENYTQHIYHTSMAINFQIILFEFLILQPYAHSARKSVCIVVAPILHYVTMVTFFLSLFSSYNFYYQFIKVVRRVEVEHIKIKIIFVGWFVPFVIVAACVLSGGEYFTQYGFYDYVCYPSMLTIQLGFFTPAGIVVVFNTVLYIVIVLKLMSRKFDSKSQSSTKNLLLEMRFFIYSFSSMCLPWIFGLLSQISQIGEVAFIILQAIFIITCTLQGFSIFVIILKINTKVRSIWDKFLNFLLFY